MCSTARACPRWPSSCTSAEPVRAAALAAKPFEAEYKASKTTISNNYKAAKAKCGELKSHAKDVCLQEAKAQENNDLADLEFRYTSLPADAMKAKVVRADGAYAVAKERCDPMRGNDKDVCVKEAQLVHVAALASAKTVQAGTDARADATNDVRQAKYKVEAEKCDAMTGSNKTACLKTAESRYGKR